MHAGLFLVGLARSPHPCPLKRGTPFKERSIAGSSLHPFIKNLALRVSHSLGYDIVPLREMNERDLSLHLGKFLSRFDVDCVIDVGANAGQYRDFLRERVGYRGAIISFEPIASHVTRLKERALADAQWYIEGYALGSHDGALDLNVMLSDQFSSFLKPDNRRVPGFEKENSISARELVKMRTLDSVLPSLQERVGFKRPYLKLDTQGYDIEVLRGGAQSLNKMLGMQTEASVIGIYEGMPNYKTTIDRAEDLGFELTGFYTVSRDSSLRLIEFDCLFVSSWAAKQVMQRSLAKPEPASLRRRGLARRHDP